MIVRRDAPHGVQLGLRSLLAEPAARSLALAIHAAGQSAQLLDASVLVHEPDEPWRGALMAVGVVRAPRARVRRFVAHLPLVRGKDDHG